jgi:phage replication initiation protein
MSKPSLLVLDGETVKLRILAGRQSSNSMVHVDWFRFTTRLKFAPIPDVDVMFPRWDSIWQDNERAFRLNKLLAELPDHDWSASAQAFTLAGQIADCMGPDFGVDLDVKKGQDFYKFRWSITLNGEEVAWVGFLSSSDSPRQKSQSSTIHANIQGTACTFAASGWRDRLADLVDLCDGEVTRVDLALDFFDGYQGGIDSVRSDYRDGLCNVGGRKLKFNMVGDWENGHDRSVYLGSREAGKVTNVYEKGDQLYGAQTGSDWLRFELRYGNKLRVLSTDMLRRPDDFFAGASDWHESVLIKGGTVVHPEQVTCNGRRQVETVQAECLRNLRWLFNTAGASVWAALNVVDLDGLWEQLEGSKLPGRLKKFSKQQIEAGMASALRIISSAGPMTGGLQAVH